MARMKGKIKKKYHHLRASYFKQREKPKRLIVEKAKWYNNADSPVIFMIDDLTNAWHSNSGNSSWDKGGDWGGGLNQKGSVISFLRDNLLADFPEIKVTFFAVAGKTAQYTHHQPFSFSEPLNFNEDSKRFFRALNEEDKFEIAYHGYNHGTPGEKTEDFEQEWTGFQSVQLACEQIQKGKEIFEDVFGEYPLGGKYGGWGYNEFGDETIDKSGFLWWFRDWMPRNTSGWVGDSYYDPQFFGENFVVALPSTIHGFFWNKKQVHTLLSKKQIISIEEHISPIRPDGIIQTPNIIDDIGELRRLFAYLAKKNVWYATGTEIAKYFIGYSQSLIFDIKPDRFKIKYSGRITEPILTLKTDCSSICTPEKPFIDVILPDNKKLSSDNFIYDARNFLHIVNIPVSNGAYLFEAKQ